MESIKNQVQKLKNDYSDISNFIEKLIEIYPLLKKYGYKDSDLEDLMMILSI